MINMETFQNTVGGFLDDLASGESTPGGGAAAALTASQAAALLSMVLNFTVGRKKYAAVEEEMRGYLGRTERLRTELLALADIDSEAFGAVAACYTMPRGSDEEKAARVAAMQAALKEAAEVPLTIADLCAEILEIASPVAEKGNVNVVSDAASAAHLAFAALQSSLVNVRINLKYLNDSAYVSTARGRVEGLEASAASNFGSARDSSSKTLGIAI